MKTRQLFLSFMLVAVFALSACNLQISFLEERVVGSGNMVTETYEVSDFNRLSLEGWGQLNVRQGEEESLSVTTDDNIIEFVDVRVRNDTLILDMNRNDAFLSVDPSDGIKFDLVVRDLERVELTGAWSVDIDGLEVEDLRLDLTGAGQVEVDSLVADELVLRQSGAGSVVMSGQVKGQDVSMSGAGSYFAAELESETAFVELTGVGTATVWATETLDVEITSIGNVVYYGSPRVVQSVTGLGKLISQGDK